MKKPKISIIIRTKNEEKWISHCLKMIYLQTESNFEIIIVDNESDDSTLNIVKRFEIKKILKIKKFLPGKAINLGLKFSSGEFIVCISAHCIPKNKYWLQNLYKNFINNKSLAGVYGRQIPISYSSPSDKRDLLITFGLDKRIQIKDNFFHNANSMIKKSILNKYPFDENVKNIEDRLWGKKIIKAGFQIIYEPEAIVYHHHGIHQNNKPDRASSVVSIIEKFEKNRIIKLPELLKPENLNIAAIIPFPSEAKNLKLHKNLLNKTIKEVLKSKYIKKIYLLSEKNLINNKKILFIDRIKNKISNKLSIDHILFKSLKIIEKNKYYPDSLMFVSYDYYNRPSKLLDKIIMEAQLNGSDTTFAAYLDYAHYWFKSEKDEFVQVDKSLQSREKKKPIYRALYGLGCLTSSHIIRTKKIIGGKIRIIPIDNIKYTYRER